MVAKTYKTVTLIVPTHNRLDCLKQLIGSIRRQSVLPFEVIIIDNSTNNDTFNYFSNSKKSQNKDIIYIKENISLSSYYARNRGIKKAKGEVLAFLDDDCTVKQDWISQILNYLNKHPNCCLMGRNLNAKRNNIVSIVDDFRTRRHFEKNLYQKKGDYHSKYLDTKNFAIKKDILLKNNLFFDEIFLSHGDIDFGLRLNQHNIPIIYCTQMIAYHYGVSSFLSLINKEFTKGNARNIFERKWKILDNKSLSEKFSVIQDLAQDKVMSGKPLLIKLISLYLIFLCAASYKFGKRYHT